MKKKRKEKKKQLGEEEKEEENLFEVFLKLFMTSLEYQSDKKTRKETSEVQRKIFVTGRKETFWNFIFLSKRKMCGGIKSRFFFCFLTSLTPVKQFINDLFKWF